MMLKGNYGGQKSYYADFELAEDLTPDPFSEEPAPTSCTYMMHQKGKFRKRSKKINNTTKSEITEDELK